jgi:hypothetical protein
LAEFARETKIYIEGGVSIAHTDKLAKEEKRTYR